MGISAEYSIGALTAVVRAMAKKTGKSTRERNIHFILRVEKKLLLKGNN